MIKLQIIGHLGADALVKDVNGQQVISFSVAHSEKYKDQQGNQKEKTTWVNCSKWIPAGGSTNIAPYLTKGTQVYCEGVPSANAYMKDNAAIGSLNCTVFQIQLLGSANAAGAAAPAAASTQPPPPPAPQFINGAWVTATWNGSAWTFPGGAAASAPVDDLPF